MFVGKSDHGTGGGGARSENEMAIINRLLHPDKIYGASCPELS